MSASITPMASSPLSAFDRAPERSRLAGPRAGHEVEKECLLALEVGAEFVCKLIVAFKHPLLDFVNLIHFVLLPP
jgi:hypothetical protein